MALYSEYSKDVRQLLIEKDSQISKLENDLVAQQNFYETQLEELKLALETKVMSSCTQEEQEDETLNIKSLFEQIRKVFIEYKETVNLLEKEKATVFKNKFIEYASKDTDDTIQKFFEMLNSIKDKCVPLEVHETQDEDLLTKTKEENISLTNELNQIKSQLQSTQNEMKELNAKYENILHRVENDKQLHETKDKIITQQQEQNKIINESIKLEREKYKAMEITCNQIKVDKAMVESDMDQLFTVTYNIISKNKKDFESNLKKLEHDNRINIEELVKKYKTFK